jgi:hypothetical protein
VDAVSRLGCVTIDVILQTNSELTDDGDPDGSTATRRAITAITELCEHVTDNRTRQIRHPGTGRCPSLGGQNSPLTPYEL